MTPTESRLPSSVLFICGMNAIRSPMAAGITKFLMPTKFYINSAGVHAGHADPFVAAVMEEMGIDYTGHVPQSLVELDVASFELVITLAPEAHHKALEFTRSFYIQVEYWPTADPTVATGTREQILDAYRAVRDGLSKNIRQRFSY